QLLHVRTARLGGRVGGGGAVAVRDEGGIRWNERATRVLHPAEGDDVARILGQVHRGADDDRAAGLAARVGIDLGPEEVVGKRRRVDEDDRRVGVERALDVGDRCGPGDSEVDARHPAHPARPRAKALVAVLAVVVVVVGGVVVVVVVVALPQEAGGGAFLAMKLPGWSRTTSPPKEAQKRRVPLVKMTAMLPCDGSSSVMPVARAATRTVAW